MNRTAPTHTSVRSTRLASAVLGSHPRRAVGAVVGGIAGLALGPRGALASHGGAEAETAALADLSLSYSDVHGPGQLMITPVGADAATGGTAVSVHLAQARGPFAGAGFVRPVEGQTYVL